MCEIGMLIDTEGDIKDGKIGLDAASARVGEEVRDQNKKSVNIRD